MRIMDTLVSIMLIPTTPELIRDIAAAAKARRLSMNLTQRGLAQRSGVSLGTLKKFERTGKISLESLLNIAMALGATQGFESLFATPASVGVLSLDELLKLPKERKRGSVT